MLKLKDNVNFEKLKAFGFQEKVGGCYYGDEQSSVLYIEPDRTIGVYSCVGYIDEDIDDELLDKLFDLITAELVEKVEEL